MSGTRNNSFYIYGKNAVEETLKTDAKNVTEVLLVTNVSDIDNNIFINIMSLAKKAKVPVRYIDKKEQKELVGDAKTQRVLAKLKGFRYLDFKEWKLQLNSKTINPESGSQLVLVLDKVEDPQNFGAIIRSAGAVGVSGVFVANASQAPVNATVFKTSAGVITRVPIVQVANITDTLKKLKELDFWVYGVDMADDVDSKDSKVIWEQDFDNKTVLVVGAEGSGLSKIAKDNCDFLVHIPMENGVESLNVSVSAAVAMYWWKYRWHQ